MVPLVQQADDIVYQQTCISLVYSPVCLEADGVFTSKLVLVWFTARLARMRTGRLLVNVYPSG